MPSFTHEAENRQAKSVAQGHTAAEWQSWEFKDSTPGSLAPESHMLDHYIVHPLPQCALAILPEDIARIRRNHEHED